MRGNVSIFDEIYTKEQRERLLYEIKDEQLRDESLSFQSFPQKVKKIHGECAADRERRSVMKDMFPSISNITECMLQAELYHQCKILNIGCYLEVYFPGGRLDALLEVDGQLIIVEFKIISYEKKINHIIQSSGLIDQLHRYAKHGIPIVLLTNNDNIGDLLPKIVISNFSLGAYFFNHDHGEFESFP